MLDERFSAEAFAVCGLNTKQSLQLAKDLASEIQNELHIAITSKLLNIVERLNGMGHNLKLYGPPIPGDISYRDAVEDESGYHCKLRVGVDTVISTGYAHLCTDQPLDDPAIDWLDPNSWPDTESSHDHT